MTAQTAQAAQVRPGVVKVEYDPTARNVDQLVKAGVFDLNGFTPMEVGKLSRHTEQMTRFRGRAMCSADMYWQLAADASTVKFIRNGVHMVGDPDGAGTEVGALAYRALAIPEHCDDATANSQNTISSSTDRRGDHVTDTATAIKMRAAVAFPGVRFSVRSKRSSGHDQIICSWNQKGIDAAAFIAAVTKRILPAHVYAVVPAGQYVSFGIERHSWDA